MKKNILYVLSIAAFLISCGGDKEESKQAKLDELKAERAKIDSKISEIEKELALGVNDSSTKKKILVELMPMVPQFFKTYIDVQGRVDADENVSLSSEIPGTITKINVKPGDEVSRGQVLAETDAKTIQQSLQDLQTNLELVNQLYEKQKSLWDQKIGTEIQFLQAKTNKESLEKKRDMLLEQLKMTKIISPINGTVDAVDIKVGQAIAPGLPAIRVINFNNLKVKADLSESYASRVKKGNEVIIYFPDTQDSILSKVLHSARSINVMSRTFGVEVFLDNKKEYHPNMVTRLKINDYVSKSAVTVVPVKVIQRNVSGETYVYVGENKSTVKKMVKTGKEYNGMIEVLEGLKEGDNLIIKGFENLNEGDEIITNQ